MSEAEYQARLALNVAHATEIEKRMGDDAPFDLPAPSVELQDDLSQRLRRVRHDAACEVSVMSLAERAADRIDQLLAELRELKK